ncbi:IclR family transcriptional regulator [Hoeflea halophila]|uniref:IclR family transcriptional regulator n=1 Tax=Hoeflea halophila TaxID=714899 RepID=A0A286IEV8_9HYPH|nr:IclR family transcriptional regulator [Hoeflea halophila]SOE18648.1 IclR family transcriptional regulator [Hoeflea halophila]
MHLDRLIAILEMIAVAGRPLSVAEVQKATGLPKPTCYRLMQTLHEQRLVDDPDGSSRFVIGERLIRIALLGKSDADVRRCSAPLLKSAAIEFRETVFLARFRNSQVEIIHVETPDDPKRGYIYPGIGVRPMHSASCSKAIAAFAEDQIRDAILHSTLRQHIDHLQIGPDRLQADFDRIADLGYAECEREIDIGVASVAAPVFVGNFGAAFSVGALGPVSRFDASYRAALGRNLSALAVRVGGVIQLCNAADV